MDGETCWRFATALPRASNTLRMNLAAFKRPNHRNAAAPGSHEQGMIFRYLGSSFSRFSRLVALVAFAVGAVFALSPLAAQQDEGPSSSAGVSFVTPFPEGDTYQLQVYGDGFAEGMLAGLVEALVNEPRIQVLRKHKPIGALVRPEWEDDIKPEDTSREVVHLGVIMLGLNDRDRIRVGNGRNWQISSDEWQAEYGRRVDRVLKALKKRQIALYLVGQRSHFQARVDESSVLISL